MKVGIDRPQADCQVTVMQMHRNPRFNLASSASLGAIDNAQLPADISASRTSRLSLVAQFYQETWTRAG
jgi:hypothetical protein